MTAHDPCRLCCQGRRGWHHCPVERTCALHQPAGVSPFVQRARERSLPAKVLSR